MFLFAYFDCYLFNFVCCIALFCYCIVFFFVLFCFIVYVLYVVK